MTLHEKMAMLDLQRYPLNLNLIKNAEDTVAILRTRKVFNSYNFSIASYNASSITDQKSKFRLKDLLQLLYFILFQNLMI